MRRKLLAMLTSRQNVPRAIFMQISAAITENSIFGHISVNNDDNWTNKVSTPMLWGAETMSGRMDKKQ